MLTRDEILARSDMPTEEVEVPEWGGTVMVYSLTGAERDAFEQACSDQRSGRKVRIQGLKALLVILCARDEAGNRLFTDEDRDTLNSKSGAALDRIYQVAARLNHLLAEDVEELVGN